LQKRAGEVKLAQIYVLALQGCCTDKTLLNHV
jgi:hypothetical protein